MGDLLSGSVHRTIDSSTKRAGVFVGGKPGVA